MQTRDGVRLDADVYIPEGEGPFPVLLMRQPYGRAIASTVVYAHPIWYASHGYIVVIQDVRGRGSSEGTFELFAKEGEDGYDTVQWAASLPGSDGQVGMYGFSYQGMTQLHAAAAQPPALKVLAPAMVGNDLYADWAYENGALLLQAGLGWALQLAAETARRKGQVEAYQQLYQAARNLPLTGIKPAYPDILAELAPDSFFHQWLKHPQPDDYWSGLTPDLSRVDLPMLHIGGWFDPYLRGDLRRFHGQVSQSSQPHQLWVGPWSHIPWGRRSGEVDFGDNANSPMDGVQVRWFDRFLKADPADLLTEAPIRLFEMGTNRWLSLKQWPRTQAYRYFLTSSGLAAIRLDDGALSDSPPANASCDLLVHDPWRPVPSLGGHSSVPSGAFERSAIDSRSDVLTYTTRSLLSAISVAGDVKLRLYCAADAPCFDLSAVLSVVRPSGQVINFTQGYCRVEHQEASLAHPRLISLPLQASCFHLSPDDALRLSLSAASFPAYPINPGTGEPAADVETIRQRVITIAIYHGPDHESCLMAARAERDDIAIG
ncbi:S15 family X-Pro dipeptidyl-peptidase [filamentous cyanobacterium CCP5]|nr:S15 family X-Pro dipeptidyl-peptidase [filamentous cyanobacterium CCP5]